MNLRDLAGASIAAWSVLVAAACTQPATPIPTPVLPASLPTAASMAPIVGAPVPTTVIASTNPVPTVTACPAALLMGYLMQRDGELVVDANGDPEGDFTPVKWQPWEYRVETDGRELFLHDASGERIAVEGDFVRLGGGEAEGSGVFTVCGPIEVESEQPQILFLQNRGGPALTVRISDVEVATVECGVYSSITAGLGGAPLLPWNLTIVRDRDSTTILTKTVVALPRWFLQIGDEVLGRLSPIQPGGPPGPTCPPGELP